MIKKKLVYRIATPILIQFLNNLMLNSLYFEWAAKVQGKKSFHPFYPFQALPYLRHF